MSDTSTSAPATDIATDDEAVTQVIPTDEAPTDDNTVTITETDDDQADDQATAVTGTDPEEGMVPKNATPNDSAPLRRSRGLLEADVKNVTDLFVQGQLELPEGVTALTPHFIGLAIKNIDGLESAPSTGAVAAVLNRWEEIGYAVLSEKPRAFAGYTEEAGTLGLAALKERNKTGKRDARRAAREAEAAAAATPAPASTNVA